MELNELREECENLEAQVETARIELDRREYQREELENNRDEYMKEKAKEQGYSDTSDKRYTNDMPKN